MNFLEYIRPQLEKEVYDFFASPREKILFGKGRQATIMKDACAMMGQEVEALVSTKDEATKEEFLRNIKSYTVESFPREQKTCCDILIAVNEKWNSEIEYTLRENGFQHIYKANHWESVNQIIREGYFDFMMQIHGMSEDGSILEKDHFKICSWKKMSKEYAESFLVEAVDILYPFLFHEVGACVEGPYEYGAVRCEKGVVIDAGANIGMFSCCAASKGCKVYAFEPTRTARDYLKKNAELYSAGEIEILGYALSDRNGKACFTVNDLGEGTKNRLTDIAAENSHLEEVATISLDSFVEQRGERVDFIKADIEGAERNLLIGAQNTLKRYAPRLSLCTYHLPDDKEVLTKLIVQANPKYKITYGWHKLYAYVPEEEK
ncbi:MAG: FkbM family methyltransferase [Lachnospiraceae bacterium]